MQLSDSVAMAVERLANLDQQLMQAETQRATLIKGGNQQALADFKVQIMDLERSRELAVLDVIYAWRTFRRLGL